MKKPPSFARSAALALSLMACHKAPQAPVVSPGYDSSAFDVWRREEAKKSAASARYQAQTVIVHEPSALEAKVAPPTAGTVNSLPPTVPDQVSPAASQPAVDPGLNQPQPPNVTSNEAPAVATPPNTDTSAVSAAPSPDPTTLDCTSILRDVDALPSDGSVPREVQYKESQCIYEARNGCLKAAELPREVSKGPRKKGKKRRSRCSRNGYFTCHRVCCNY